MTDKEEVERLRDALVGAEEALDDAERALSAAVAKRDALRIELTATKRALTASDTEVRELKTRLGLPSIVRNGNVRCHTCGASITTAVDEWKVRFDEADARIQRLETRLAEATDWKGRAETAEARVRQLELRIGLAEDDWGSTR